MTGALRAWAGETGGEAVEDPVQPRTYPSVETSHAHDPPMTCVRGLARGPRGDR
jgi:hypothetical protein